MPVVTIRDPYLWMQSMCRRPYAARFQHTQKHCPNLLANSIDAKRYRALKQDEPVPVRVKYRSFVHSYESLAHMWSEYYEMYLAEARFPRLMVRLEDLVFHAPETISQICRCVGGKVVSKFAYRVNSTKPTHYRKGTPTGLVEAMMLYGNLTRRYQGYEHEDLIFANRVLNQEVMNAFDYPKWDETVDEVL